MNFQHKPLRVLLVEDSQNDADLILLALEESGFDAISERVETAGALRAALARGSWDAVISDYNLPRFSADGALATLRETGSDIPFIVVSGCIGEESAVALMKEGASDFVMKNQLARLAPAIERELREADMRREHRLAHEALRAHEELLDGIASALGEGVLVLDAGGRLVFMNPEAERLLGWTPGELRGKEVHRIIHSQKQDGTPLQETDCSILGVLSDGKARRSEDDVFWRKDGSPVPVSIVASAIVKDGKPVASVVAFQDIAQRKLAEHELLESRRQLRELSSHLLAVREEERARIARELHDQLGQMLTGVKLDVKWLASGLYGQKPIVMDKIASMSELIDATLDEMRRIAADLRPTMLDDLGLEAAIEWLAEDFGRRTGLHVSFDLDAAAESGERLEECEPDAEVATAAYRIVQECLTNIVRHAKALHVEIFLGCSDGNLVLRVTDDGRGMDASGERKRKSFGTVGMRERACSLGGTLEITSAPGKGTSVEAVLPVKPAISKGATQ